VGLPKRHKNKISKQASELLDVFFTLDPAWHGTAHYGTVPCVALRYRAATHGAVQYLRAVQCRARKQTRIHTVAVPSFFHRSS